MNLKHVFRSLATSALLGAAGYAGAQDVTGLYNVDLSTGTANIQVPVSGYSLGGNEFGASLSYNTKGVPVREFAGIVGSHWNLNTGGSITRVIKGLPDEWYSPAYQEEGDHTESIFISTYSQYRGRLIEGMETPAQKNNQKVYRDPESDEYYFNVGNVSFQFFLGREGAIYCNTKQKYEITILTEDGNIYKDQPLPVLPPYPTRTQLQRAFTFKVKDPQSGLSYYFSRSASATMSVIPFFRGKFSLVYNANCYSIDDPVGIAGEGYRAINSWKLDSVVSAANEKITYRYERFIYPHNYNMDTTAYQVLHTYVSAAFGAKNDTIKAGSKDPMTRFPDSIDLVTEITYPYNGSRLIFNYEKTTPRLEFWKASNQGNTSIDGVYYYSRLNTVQYIAEGQSRLYKLDYTYFHTPNGSYTQAESNEHLGDADDMYSLKLKSLSVRDAWTGNFQLLYGFGYNDNKARRFAKGQDYYGYFKGDLNNNTRPGHSIYGIENREPDATYMQYGILNRITSGTGARVSFDYGTHLLLPIASAMTSSPDWVGNTTSFQQPGSPGYVIGDGLKLNQVTIEDINDPETRYQVSYNYVDGQYFIPGGIYTLPTYFLNSGSDTVKGKHIYESFMNPGYFHNGTNHAYSMVTEKHTNRYGQQLSLKKYQLSNAQDGLSDKKLVAGGGQLSLGFPFTRKQYMRTWEMGLPLNIKTYDDKDLLLEEQLYTYQFVTDTLSSLLAKVNDTNRVLSNVAQGPILYDLDGVLTCAKVYSYKLHHDPYRPYKGLSLLKTLETRNYINNTEYTAELNTYDYDARNNVKSARQQNSKGEFIENYSVYNYDIPATADPALLKMQQEGSEYLVATERWNNGTGNPGIRNTGSRLLKGSVFKYKLENGGIYNEKVMETALEAPLAYNSHMSGGSGNASAALIAAYSGGTLPAHLKELTQVKRRDGRGNPLETYLPAIDDYKAMIWDTLSGHKLADVVGARYSNIAYSGFEYGTEHNLQLAQAYILRVSESGIVIPPGFAEFIPVAQTLTGSNFCLLKSGSTTAKRLYTEGLEPGIRYRATFWASDNTLPEFGIEGGAQFALNQIAVKGPYKQYEVFFSPALAGQKIGLSSPSVNIAIDELRIHPVEAQMTSYTYQGLNGKVAETDALGRIIFYEYDGLGRLHLLRDQEGNILQKKSYGVQVAQ